ncbi:hypothetical protein HZB01_05010 [Candidatus Woesearchaeota archaeon]|nr:hypothetical protein [Candidatus Woesearchaeota archaeon]
MEKNVVSGIQSALKDQREFPPHAVGCVIVGAKEREVGPRLYAEMLKPDCAYFGNLLPQSVH